MRGCWLGVRIYLAVGMLWVRFWGVGVDDWLGVKDV